MKAYLMYPDRDFEVKGELPANAQDLIQDLELDLILDAMAQDDPFLREVARRAFLTSLTINPETIRYRQAVLRDCLAHERVVRDLYALAVEALASEKKIYFGLFHRSPGTILHRAIDVLNMFLDVLAQLQQMAQAHAADFVSEGFTNLFAMLERELSDDYLAGVRGQLKELLFNRGELISARLGKGNKGMNYMLRRLPQKRKGIAEWLFGPQATVHTVYIADRDESGARALGELKDQGINTVANALAQSADHIVSFFTMLRAELAFHIGCLNLHERLVQKGEPVCLPVPGVSGERRHACRGLYDVALALLLEENVVGNDLAADGKALVIITGANQGGKSTFLRSIGQAQLMMQCGMFVGAESFAANVCDGLFTHYKREEDATMKSGKLDEELSRLSDIVNHITPNAMLLFNESFAATNEREGSELARQIVRALLEKRIKVFFVSHLYDFTHSMYDKHLGTALFLRAERQDDGARTFKLQVGEPLQTSFGVDLYGKVFGAH